MKKSRTQKDLVKAWAKIEFNSLYGVIPLNSFKLYDEITTRQVRLILNELLKLN
jgi:hypothetical protein